MQLEKRKEKIASQLHDGFCKAHAFLHIGKTGGSGIGDLRRAMLKYSDSVPIQFGHWWTIEEIFAHYPDTQISFIIRDPLERFVSGFNSRLRQGRPRNNNPWTPQEATAFAFFKNVDSLFRAIISEEVHAKSAAKYAFENITHLAWSYAHHFKDVETIERYGSHIYHVGHIEHMDEAIRGIFSHSGIDAQLLVEHYQKTHVSAQSSKSILDGFSDDEQQKLKAAFAQEYAIYNHLKNKRVLDL